MQHVTFQTAVRLKKAGFSQKFNDAGLERRYYVISQTPTGKIRKWGQVCVNIYPHLTSYQIGSVNTESGSMLHEHERLRDQKIISEFSFFAPTATDILRELRGDYSLCYHAPHWRCELIDAFEPVDYWQDENPAEACAKAWLEKKKTVSS